MPATNQQSIRQPFFRSPQPTMSQRMPNQGQATRQMQAQYGTSPNQQYPYNTMPQMYMQQPGQGTYIPQPQPMVIQYQAPQGIRPQYITTSQQGQFVATQPYYQTGQTSQPTPTSEYSSAQTTTAPFFQKTQIRQPTPTLYYPPSNPQQMTLQQPARPPSQPSAAMTPQQTYQKREKRIIQIVNPNTGKDITEDITHISGAQKSGTPPLSDSSSARDTPTSSSTPPPAGLNQNEIAAQFAAQVAATLKPGMQHPVPRHPDHVGMATAEPEDPTKQEDAVQQPTVATTTTTSEGGTNQEEDDTLQEKDVPQETTTSPQQVTVPTAASSDVKDTKEVAAAQRASEVKTAEVSVSSATEVDVPLSTERTSAPVEGDERTRDSSAVSGESTVDGAAPSKGAPAAAPAVKREEIASVVKEPVTAVQETPVPAVVPDEGRKASLTRKQKQPEPSQKAEDRPGTDLDASDMDQASTSQQSSADHDNSSSTPVVNNIDKQPPPPGEQKGEHKSRPETKQGPPLSEISLPAEMVKTDSSASQGLQGLSLPAEMVRTTTAVADQPTKGLSGLQLPSEMMRSSESTKEVANVEPEEKGDSVKSNAKADDKGDPASVRQVEIEVVEKDNENNVAEENQKNSAKTLESQQKGDQAPPTPELKYEYKEDQWSPLNPEGKKEYDREFLLQMQFSSDSLTKPEGLPKLPDVILERPHSRPMKGNLYSGAHSGGVDFTPGFVKSAVSPRGPGGPMGGGGGSGGRRSQQKPQKEIKIIRSVQISQEAQLKPTENAWKPAKKDNNKEKDEEAKTEDLLRRVRGILNKLTPQKFAVLMEQILQLPIDSEPKLKGLIDLIYEKAVDEPNFSVAYANMCKHLARLKVPDEAGTGREVNFRKLLLNKCQREFEQNNEDETENETEKQKKLKELEEADTEEKKKLIQMQIDEKEMKARRRSLGNIKFIGELFKLEMLTEAIMHNCLFKLLKAGDEESIECLCRLMSTVGKLIDHPKAKPKVDQYFNRMNQIVQQRKTSSRVRFMLQDVIDLRQSNWVPRRDETNPKTIDQIHKEAEKEAAEKALLRDLAPQQHQMGQQGRPRGRERGDRGGNQPQRQDESGWSTVGSAKASRIDPSKMKISKQPVDDNIQLGPGGRPGFGSWGRGSSGGGAGAKASQENERPSTPSNRYAALSGSTDGLDQRGLGRGAARGLAARDAKGRGQMMRPGRHMGRMSREEEKESREGALNAARHLARPASRDSSLEGSSRGNSRENSKTRMTESRPSPVEKAPSPLAQELSKADMERKTKAIIDEFLHLQDIKEAILCVSELNSPGMMHHFVSTALNHVLERSVQARRHTGHLLHDLVKQKYLTVDAYLKGLKEILEFAEDMEIDIPKIWDYLGELIGPMVQDGSIPLSFLRDACELLVVSNKAGTLIAAVLHDASHRLGHIRIGELWAASGLAWTDFLAKGCDVEAFVKKHKLEFLTSPEVQSPKPEKPLTVEQLREGLSEILLKRQAENDDVIDWIEAKVPESETKNPQFIRVLMTAVCQSAIQGTGSHATVNESEIAKRALLLTKYLDNEAELELQALFALQALVHSLEHPPMMLQRFFDKLYDEDVISEDAFNQWDSSTDPGEQEGKGVAQKSVVQFFTWLRNTDADTAEAD
ncbi:eukaryotic translation initiation factor 4 gamma 1 isoform X3 [Lingula anatina]|nr:eukaryotic translation initiation factor 4 gamma 1 isoform X3 [Lingula anatina]|eukprot:XP_013390980.1 eukaryotic translation initiation factor 4 gamma 1 isoform X3 [Lingula anatina]